jgi:hypothetical protein
MNAQSTEGKRVTYVSQFDINAGADGSRNLAATSSVKGRKLTKCD